MQLKLVRNNVRHLMSLRGRVSSSLRSSHAARQLKCQKYIMNTKQTRAGRDEEAGRAESNADVDVAEDGNHIALQFWIVPDIAACLSFTRKYFVQ